MALEHFKLLPTEFIPALKDLGPQWGIPIVLTGALFGGILLAAISRPIIMLYEGYPFRRFRPFRFLTTRQRRQRQKLSNRLKLILEEYRKLPKEEKEGPRAAAMISKITQLQDRANNLFPPEPEDVLPTRLGNAIRAFEMYANLRYGIDPITLWSRLLSVLPKEFLDKVKEVRTSFNFLINTVLLVQLLGLELLVVAFYKFNLWLLLGAFTSIVISYFIYRAAVARAIDWGYMFNTAFDLYRRDLLKQLGFRPPETIEEEKKLWLKILQLIMYKETKDLKFSGEKLEKKEEG